MNRYHQLTSEERHTLSTLRKQGYRPAAIARALGRCTAPRLPSLLARIASCQASVVLGKPPGAPLGRR